MMKSDEASQNISAIWGYDENRRCRKSVKNLQDGSTQKMCYPPVKLSFCSSESVPTILL